MKFTYLLLIVLILFGSCQRNSIAPVDLVSGKIKSIEWTDRYSATDSTVNKILFYYNSNGILDYFTYNDITIHPDSFLLDYTSNNYVHVLVNNRINGIPDYMLTDSALLHYNSYGYTDSQAYYHIESGACLNKTAITQLDFQALNLIQYKNTTNYLGCTPASYYTSITTTQLFYDNAHYNSITNENMGMPYFGKSSNLALDSLTVEACSDLIVSGNFECNVIQNQKVHNYYDAENKIIKTNILPYTGLIPFLTLMFSEPAAYPFLQDYSSEYYEIAYY